MNSFMILLNCFTLEGSMEIVPVEATQNKGKMIKRTWLAIEEIFAKDRAIGVVAAHAADREDESIDLSSIRTHIEESEDHTFTKTVTGQSSKGGKKRKIQEIENLQDQLISKIESAIKSGNDQVAEILKGFTVEKKINKSQLRSNLFRIPSLQMVHVVQALHKMTSDDVDTFYALETEAEREAFVQILLGL